MLTICVVTESSPMNLASLTSLICNYFTHDIHEYGPEDVHIFILLANTWLMNLNSRPGPPDALAALEAVWTKMAAFAEFALRAGLPNCGCFFALPWLEQVSHVYYSHLPTLLGGRHRAYMRLVHALDAVRRRGLLTGSHTHTIADLMCIVHEGQLELCDVPQCELRWHPMAQAQDAQREDNVGGAGSALGFDLAMNRRSQSLLVYIRQLPRAPSAHDVVDFTLEILGDAREVTRDVAAAYVNIWQWFCNPATGWLKAENIVPFFKVGRLPSEWHLTVLMM